MVSMFNDMTDLPPFYRTSFMYSANPIVNPNYNCVAVNSGQECLDLMRKMKFDLVLLDLSMPDMSGLDVLSALGEEPLSHNIVLFTAATEYNANELEKLK